MKEKPYFSSVSWLPMTSEARIASRMLNTRNAKKRVPHSKAVSSQGAERSWRGFWESLIAEALVAAADPFSVAARIESSSLWIVRGLQGSRTKKEGGLRRPLQDQRLAAGRSINGPAIRVLQPR